MALPQRKVESKEERYMDDASLADLSLPDRIAALISLSQRFGPVLPVYGVIFLDGSWKCECRKGEACPKAGKHPRLKSWATAATKSPKQIADWCIQFPRANWAIVAGEFVDVLDLDRKQGMPDGIATLKSWEAAHGALPASVRVTTGCGEQVYFQRGSGLRTSANSGIGIDARAAGSGYVLAPGSRHKNGRVYQIVEENELQACPAWLIEELYQNQPDTESVTIDGIHSKGRVGGGGVPEAQAITLPANLKPAVRRVRGNHPGRPTNDGGIQDRC